MPLILATHNGAHHADDVFAAAVLTSIFPSTQVIRTRDPQLIEPADFAVDVGGQWDAARGRFDHHQRGFSGARSDGTAFASSGLVWAAHGEAYIRLRLPDLPAEVVTLTFAAVDTQLVAHIDRADTGADPGAPDYFGLSALVDSYNLTRQEVQLAGTATESQRLAAFLKATATVETLLNRIVLKTAAEIQDETLVRAATELHDGQVLVMPHSGLTWERVVITERPQARLVVYPDSTDQHYQIRTIPVKQGSFAARMDLPSAWAGLRDTDLAQASGVCDAVFCHTGRFIAGAKSLAGALQMAKAALPRP